MPQGLRTTSFIGGVIGASIGARHLPERVMRYVLACVLLGSGLKLIVT